MNTSSKGTATFALSFCTKDWNTRALLVMEKHTHTMCLIWLGNLVSYRQNMMEAFLPEECSTPSKEQRRAHKQCFEWSCCLSEKVIRAEVGHEVREQSATAIIRNVRFNQADSSACTAPSVTCCFFLFHSHLTPVFSTRISSWSEHIHRSSSTLVSGIRYGGRAVLYSFVICCSACVFLWKRKGDIKEWWPKI